MYTFVGDGFVFKNRAQICLWVPGLHIASSIYEVMYKKQISYVRICTMKKGKGENTLNMPTVVGHCFCVVLYNEIGPVNEVGQGLWFWTLLLGIAFGSVVEYGMVASKDTVELDKGTLSFIQSSVELFWFISD